MHQKKSTLKAGKVENKFFDKSGIKVHQIIEVPTPQALNNSKKALSTVMCNKNFKWSQSMFYQHFWTTHQIVDLRYCQTSYDTVQEDEIYNPLQLTCIDNVICGEDYDLHAACLLFVLPCSQCVHHAAL